MAAPSQNSDPTAGTPGACHRRLVRLFGDVERNALMTALRNAADVDAANAPYPEDDLIYLYMEQTPKTSFVSELVDELHRPGFHIEPNS
jgi:hypothetical protein